MNILLGHSRRRRHATHCYPQCRQEIAATTVICRCLSPHLHGAKCLTHCFVPSRHSVCRDLLTQCPAGLSKLSAAPPILLPWKCAARLPTAKGNVTHPTAPAARPKVARLRVPLVDNTIFRSATGRSRSPGVRIAKSTQKYKCQWQTIVSGFYTLPPGSPAPQSMHLCSLDVTTTFPITSVVVNPSFCYIFHLKKSSEFKAPHASP